MGKFKSLPQKQKNYKYLPEIEIVELFPARHIDARVKKKLCPRTHTRTHTHTHTHARTHAHTRARRGNLYSQLVQSTCTVSLYNLYSRFVQLVHNLYTAFTVCTTFTRCTTFTSCTSYTGVKQTSRLLYRRLVQSMSVQCALRRRTRTLAYVRSYTFGLCSALCY